MSKKNRNAFLNSIRKPVWFGAIVVIVALTLIGLAWLWNNNPKPASELPIIGINEMPLNRRFFDVNQLSFSPDGQLLTTASYGGSTHLWNLQGKLQAKLPGKQVIFSPDGKLIATVSPDSKVHLWNLKGEQLLEFKGHDHGSGGIQFSPSGLNLLTVNNGSPQLWDLQGKLIATFDPVQLRNTKIHKSKNGITLDLTLHTLDEGVVFNGDGQRIASAANSLNHYHAGRIWNLQGQLLFELQGHQQAINQIVFSPDGQYLATASSDGTTRLWDTQGRPITEFKKQQSPIAKLSFSPDGKYLATLAGKNSSESSVILWDLQGHPLQEFTPERRSKKLGRWGIENFGFSPDSRMITILWSGSFQLVNLPSLQEISFSQEPGSYFQGNPDTVVFSPDGKTIAIASDNGSALLFDLQGKKLMEFKGV